jgi:hypothetical protein
VIPPFPKPVLDHVFATFDEGQSADVLDGQDWSDLESTHRPLLEDEFWAPDGRE